MAEHRKVGRVPAPDMVRDGLRQAIVAGNLAPGTQLRQDELAERFGTSRIPVREALRQLEAEGLVTILPNRGATVSMLTLAEVIELMDIRIALECRALRLAVPNMGEEDFEAAALTLRRYDEEPEPERWGEMNWIFHEALYAPCGRSRLLAMIVANYGHVGRFTRAWVSIAAGKERPQREHHAILQACRTHATDKAVSLLEDHIVQTQRSLMRLGRRLPVTQPTEPGN